MILRNTGDVRRAMALRSQLLQWAAVYRCRETGGSVCVYVLEFVDLFKASSSGDFGIHLLLMRYQRASFSNSAPK